MNLPLPDRMEHGLPAHLSEVEVGLRPEHVRIVPSTATETHRTGIVNDLEPLGMHTTVGIDLAGINLALTVAGVQEFNDGDRVEVHLDTETLLFFDPISGRRVGN